MMNSASANPLDWEEMKALTKCLFDDGYDRDGLLILLGSNFGLRISDLLVLKWMNLVGKTDFLLTEKKTGKHRKITIAPQLQGRISVVFHQKNAKPQDFIFANKEGKPISIQYVNQRLKRIKQKYKLNHQGILSSHSLRKTFGKRVYQLNDRSEHALILLSKIFGHSSVAITRRYIGLEEQEIQEVYLNLL